MERNRTTIPGRVLAILGPLALAACAGDPVPRAELGSASQAIQNAEQAGALQYAPVELELARSKMDAANRAVRDVLMAYGVSPDRVITLGRGEAMPVASNDSQSGRQANRRVEIVISDPGGGAVAETR